MLELSPVSIGVVRINAASFAIAELRTAFDNAALWQLSPREALLLCAQANEARMVREVEKHLKSTDPGSFTIADGDSFAAWKLEGPGAEIAFSRLSAIPLPAERPALLQGLVADAPMKVLVDQGHFLLLVGSPLSHHLRQRVLASCASIGIVERGVTVFRSQIEAVA